MTAAPLLRAALGLLRVVSRLVPAGERRRWRAQWEADVHYRCRSLERAGLVNVRTGLALAGRLCGSLRHAWWLRARDSGGTMLAHDMLQAVRPIRARPGFSAIAILTMALGIGANAVIFSWIEATLLIRFRAFATAGPSPPPISPPRRATT